MQPDDLSIHKRNTSRSLSSSDVGRDYDGDFETGTLAWRTAMARVVNGSGSRSGEAQVGKSSKLCPQKSITTTASQKERAIILCACTSHTGKYRHLKVEHERGEGRVCTSHPRPLFHERKM